MSTSRPSRIESQRHLERSLHKGKDSEVDDSNQERQIAVWIITFDVPSLDKTHLNSYTEIKVRPDDLQRKVPATSEK